MDGFRFDIMGHIMVPTMRKIQAALGALTLDKDGVDGAGLYLYGEAWDFGEVRPPTLCHCARGPDTLSCITCPTMVVGTD